MIAKGKPGRRAELAEIACALRAAGASGTEIAGIMGISRPYVSALCQDPSGKRERAAKERSRKPCPQCGSLMTAGAAHARQPRLCRTCTGAERSRNAVWTREAIIEAIRAYADRYGNPPAAYHWNPPLARKNGRPDISDRFHKDGIWPAYSSVQKHFPRWNNAIAAAGFTPLRSGHKYSDKARAS